MSQPGDEKTQTALTEAVLTSAVDVSQLLAGLEAQLEKEKGLRAWLRSRPSGVRFVLALGVACAVLALEIARSQRVADVLQHWPVLAGQALLVVSGVSLCLRSRLLVNRARLLFSGFLLLVAPFWVSMVVGKLGNSGHLSALASGSGCFVHGVLYSAPLAVMLLLLDRRDRPARESLILRGAIIGVVGNLALIWHCPSTDLLHLFSGHAGLGVGWVLGWLLWRRLTEKDRSSNWIVEPRSD